MHRLAAAAEEARAPDHGGGDGVEHERAAVELVEIDRSREAYTIPAIPAVNEHSMNAVVRIVARFTPARRAASALPPIAYR